MTVLVHFFLKINSSEQKEKWFAEESSEMSLIMHFRTVIFTDNTFIDTIQSNNT